MKSLKNSIIGDYKYYELYLITTDTSSLKSFPPWLPRHALLAAPPAVTAVTQSLLTSDLPNLYELQYSKVHSFDSFLPQEVTPPQRAPLNSNEITTTDLTSLPGHSKAISNRLCPEQGSKSSSFNCSSIGLSTSVISNFHTSSYLGQKPCNYLFNSPPPMCHIHQQTPKSIFKLYAESEHFSPSLL